MILLIFFFVFLFVEAAVCPNFCTKHGTCSNGKCLCFIGWKGADCALSISYFTL